MRVFIGTKVKPVSLQIDQSIAKGGKNTPRCSASEKSDQHSFLLDMADGCPITAHIDPPL